MAYWQDQNWDPNVGEDGFDLFCSYLNATENANIKTALVDGYPVDIGLFNYGKYIREASLLRWCILIYGWCSSTGLFIGSSSHMYRNPG